MILLPSPRNPPYPPVASEATRQTPSARTPNSSGFVLLAVLVVTLLASMVAVSALFRINAEVSSDTATSSSEQAWATALSGVHYAIRFAANAPAGSLSWNDNSAAFQQQLLTDDGSDRWYFSVYSPDEGARSEVRFGLTDEASKLNVNLLDAAALQKLQFLAPALADGLLDFIDSDSDTRTLGAEQQEYSILGRTYAVRNNSLATVGQLLLVRGFTPSLLFGDDPRLLQRFGASSNQTPDLSASATASSPSSGEEHSRGLSALLTVSSYDPNIDSSRNKRINLNDTNQSLASLDLPEPVLSYIEALHTNKTAIAHPADLLEAKLTAKDSAGHPLELDSKVGKQELPILLDHTTGTNSDRALGLVNVNSASATVLQTLPGIDLPLAESIVAARHSLDPELQKTPAWLYSQGVLNADQFKKVAPRITARSFQFSFRVLAYAVPSGRYRVVEAIIDTATTPPSITYLRDLTRLGLPFRPASDQEDKNG